MKRAAPGDDTGKGQQRDVGQCFAFKFVVPELVGRALIGKAGCNVAELRKILSSDGEGEVKISQNNERYPSLPDTEVRAILLMGPSLKALHEALNKVFSVMHEVASKRGWQDMDDGQGGVVLLTIVPRQVGSAIIGKGGDNIKKLRQEHKVKIFLEDGSSVLRGEQIARVIGSPESVQSVAAVFAGMVSELESMPASYLQLNMHAAGGKGDAGLGLHGDPSDKGYYEKGGFKGSSKGKGLEKGYEKGYEKGFEKGGYEKGGFEKGGFEKGGFEKGGFEKGGFEKGGFEKGYDSFGGYPEEPPFRGPSSFGSAPAAKAFRKGEAAGAPAPQPLSIAVNPSPLAAALGSAGGEDAIAPWIQALEMAPKSLHQQCRIFLEIPAAKVDKLFSMNGAVLAELQDKTGATVVPRERQPGSPTCMVELSGKCINVQAAHLIVVALGQAGGAAQSAAAANPYAAWS